MQFIRITSTGLAPTPAGFQSVTIRHRRLVDPDVLGSYITDGTAVAVAADGNLVVPFDITGLLDGVDYVVWITNNCGGKGFKKTFMATATTTAPATTTGPATTTAIVPSTTTPATTVPGTTTVPVTTTAPATTTIGPFINLANKLNTGAITFFGFNGINTNYINASYVSGNLLAGTSRKLDILPFSMPSAHSQEAEVSGVPNGTVLYVSHKNSSGAVISEFNFTYSGARFNLFNSTTTISLHDTFEISDISCDTIVATDVTHTGDGTPSASATITYSGYTPQVYVQEYDVTHGVMLYEGVESATGSRTVNATGDISGPQVVTLTIRNIVNGITCTTKQITATASASSL